MIKRNWTIVICLGFVSLPAMAREYYVSPAGGDTASGSQAAPMKSIQAAVKKLQPGDTLTLRGGRYHETVSLNTVRGTAGKPITIRAYPGEKPVLDGTAAIKGKWTQHKPNIWKTTLKQDIWQLFVGEKNMTLARWPNAKLWSKDFWVQEKSWAQGENFKSGYRNGSMYDKDLPAVKVSMAGCVMVINCDRWRSRATTIISHTPGTERFEFKKVNSFRDREGHHYFVTGLALLDSEEEWYYDKTTKTLYLYSKTNPANKAIRGRTIDTALTHIPKAAKKIRRGPQRLAPGQYITLDGLAFHAARVDLRGLEHLTIQNCDFLYSVCSKRTLGSTADAGNNTFDGCHNLVLFNNTFQYCDGKSLVANRANYARIENCLFYMIDYAAIAGGSNSYTIQMEGGKNIVYRRNEINTSGASEGMRISGPFDAPVLVELNFHTRTGQFQTDGASVQYPPNGNVNSINRFNWFVDVNRMAFRFDGNPGGEWGIVYRNISALGGYRGYRFKGDNHQIFHIIAMDNRRTKSSDISISDNKGPKRYDDKANQHSRILNSISQKTDLKENLITEANRNPNWNGPVDGKDIRSLLRDPDNYDFRPRKGSPLIDKGVVIDHVRIRTKDEPILSEGTKRMLDISKSFNGKAPDIGAYEYGDKNYWIPGRIMPQASRAVPRDATKTAKVDADLMWLHGRNAKQHKVYLGTSKGALKLVATQTNNIYTPAAQWTAGKTYYWRVDTVTKDGKTVTGTIWSFTCK